MPVVFVELWGGGFSCCATWEREFQMVTPGSKPLSPLDL